MSFWNSAAIFVDGDDLLSTDYAGISNRFALLLNPKRTDVAQAFGQENNVTVLTLKFAGAAAGVRGA